jgi:SAM-dependent methyltransferase
VSDVQGLGFASLAEDYDRGRGGWPPELHAGVEANTVLDLAAGTGKLTALLAERYPEAVAVEPLPTMRKILLERVPKASALAGTAEAIPLDDESVDAIFVAEAFHWFDSAAAAAREIQRVLRPSGWLVISFNVPRGWFEPGLSEEAQAVLEQVTVSARLPPGGLPKVLSGAWRSGLTAFEPLTQIDLDHDDGHRRCRELLRFSQLDGRVGRRSSRRASATPCGTRPIRDSPATT